MSNAGKTHAACRSYQLSDRFARNRPRLSSTKFPPNVSSTLTTSKRYGEPAKLVGRNVVFIANLAPRKMRFGVSEGMILSAGSGGEELFLLGADPGARPGMPVK